MQTIKENQINYFVFPQDPVSDAGLPSGSKSYFLYAYETMANNTGSGDESTLASIENQGDRWRVASAYVESTNSQTRDRLFLRAGTTYEVQLRYGILNAPLTWAETDTLWTATEYVWSYDPSFLNNSNLISVDRVFCSGSVSPNQKLYISSNEDAVMTIYQG